MDIMTPPEPQPPPYYQQSISDRAQEPIIDASGSTITPAYDDPKPHKFHTGPQFSGASPHPDYGFQVESIMGLSDLEKRDKGAAPPIHETTYKLDPLRAILSAVLNEYQVRL